MANRNQCGTQYQRLVLIRALAFVVCCSVGICAGRHAAAQGEKAGADLKTITREESPPRLARFNELNNRVLQLIQTTEFKQALEPALEALKIAETDFDPNDERLANIKNSLGVIYNNLGDYVAAEPEVDPDRGTKDRRS